MGLATGAGAARITGRRRALLVVLMLLAVQLVSLARPAYACGCGAMVHDPKTTLAVDRETSVVRWDGRSEQIVMSLTVNGTAPDAAWIMPVPHRATVELGDPGLFDQLAALTAPAVERRHHFWPRGGDWPFAGDGAGDGAPAPGARGPGVGVVGRERLGPFDVARLTATDPAALRNWLKAHGFRLPDALATELRPYVAHRWEYVAIRLAPATAHRPLTGPLEPLRLSFASDRLVYPMRLSRLAKTPQSLGLYVLAPHRMEPRSALGGTDPEVFFAGRITPVGALRELGGTRRTFLTALDQTFPQPRRITGDHELVRAAEDTPFRRITYTSALLRVAGIPAWVLTVGGTLLLLVAATPLLVLRSRRPVPPPRPLPPPLT
ncbi:DUF2330 domain-containing protein [Streptomyces lydicamycinicus]|uniref:DUF2330 domain-containing protein n=1 Tax=Streptomyces lydicamycinicus TaxID=1546107 RepID=A0A0N7YLD9_9ACTN|nr:DUF2330 domain-containing protein [Streptomyces lydicamycinicus]GAO08539.1 hypothetical protein TPA0598_04_01750 [Streptomyces lydicamycinicus]